MPFSYDNLKNPGYFAENRMPARSDHRFYPSEESLADGENPLTLSLNGIWKFFCARNAGQVPAGFEQPSFDCTGWEEIAVPAHIQMEGHGVPQYVNQQYPWDGWEEVDIGEVPMAFNPVACYVRTFTLPAAMEGKRVFLSLQGAESCAAVWLNGTYIGFSSNSFSPCEFELTDALRPGGNKLAVRVCRFSAGSWLEDQDFFRFSGLYRDVFLYAAPAVHVWDVKAEASLSEDFALGTLRLSGTLLAASPWRLELVLDGEVRARTSGTGPDFDLTAPVPTPRLWSAEYPNLYNILLRALDHTGAVTEVVPLEIGFRRFELQNGLMCLNGKRILFNGVNRHDFTSDAGRAVTTDDIRRDLITMKRNNINAVRTSHYPDSAAFYRLCDELGLYVIAENNMETHGVWNLIEAGAKSLDWALPGDRAEWEPILLDRVESTYQTCKNHPSVLIWSLGNESFGGSVIAHMADRFRALDPSRLIHYEGVSHDPRYDRESSDMVSRMYMPAAEIKAYLAEHRDRPFISCEYSHAMGNSCGGMDRYTDLAHEEPLYQGGFLWDFRDQSIRGRDRYGNLCWFYGGDCGDRPTDYAFSGNGICLSDGRESVKMPEVKANYQPLSITVDRTHATVRNWSLFRNARDWTCRVTVARNGRQIRAASCTVDVPPGETVRFPLPVPVETLPGEYAVTVSFHLREDTQWAPAGHEIAFGQGVYPIEAPAVHIPAPPLRVVRGWYNTGVIGENFRVLFSHLDGGLASYQYGGVEYLKAIPLPNFWRPVTDNDLGGQVNLYCAPWKTASAFVSCRQFGKGYWNGAYLPEVSVKENALTVTYTYHMPTSPASRCSVSYTVHADGTVDCTLHYDPVPGLPPMPEFGMLFRLDADLDRLTWYGLGPGESYADRNHGVRLGIWENKVPDNFAAHLRPQESGLHTGVRWAAVTDYRGRGLRFSGDCLSFSALPWTPHEIDCAQHPYELPPVHYTVVRCALAQMGVGGDDTWGSLPHPEYWVPSDKPLHFTFSFCGCLR